jgi:hypothetical protein
VYKLSINPINPNPVFDHSILDSIFKQTNGNESLNEISNDNGVRVAKNPTVRSAMFPHFNIHKFT